MPRHRKKNKKKSKQKRKIHAKQTKAVFNLDRKGFPMPQRYRTKLITSVNGVIPIGFIGANGTVIYGCRGNALFFPFNSAAFSTAAGFTPDVSIITPLTAIPIGLEELMTSSSGGLYSNYRVYASRVEWTIKPTKDSDAIKCCTVPIPYDYINNQNVTYQSLQTASDGPFSSGVKDIEIYSDKYKLSSYHRTNVILGLKKQEVALDPDQVLSGAYNVNPSAYWTHYLYVKMVNPGAANVGVIMLSARVHHYCEFWQSTYAGMADYITAGGTGINLDQPHGETGSFGPL